MDNEEGSILLLDTLDRNRDKGMRLHIGLDYLRQMLQDVLQSKDELGYPEKSLLH